MSNANKPVQSFRLGSISSSVFANNGDSDSTFHTITLQRSYKDGNKTRYDSSFTMRDLPAAKRCLELAQSWVEQQELHS